MWTLLVSCHSDFNSHAWPVLWGSKSKRSAYLSQLFTCTTSTPLLEEPVCCLSCCLRCGPVVGALCSPLPPTAASSNPCHTSNSPERICMLGRYLPLIGQVKAPCLGALLPMATVLRDSQGEDELLHYTSPFSGSNSSYCIFFFFFISSFFFSCRVRRGVRLSGGPHWDSFVPFNTHFGLPPSLPFVVLFFFHWVLWATLVRLLSWTWSPKSCVFEVSDE